MSPKEKNINDKNKLNRQDKDINDQNQSSNLSQSSSSKEQSSSQDSSSIFENKINEGYFLKVKILLYLLYSIQGLILNFFLGTLTLVLKSKLSYSDIATFNLCSYPFSLKLFWSPFIDNHYFSYIGKRKTWIIPTQIISALLLIYLAFNYQYFVDNHQISLFSSVCFIIVFFIATQDIALDGWALTLCMENNTMASACQTIGQVGGGLISGLLFSLLNDIDFCNKYIYSEQQTEPILSVEMFMIVIAVYIAIVTLILVIIPENLYTYVRRKNSNNLMQLKTANTKRTNKADSVNNNSDTDYFFNDESETDKDINSNDEEAHLGVVQTTLSLIKMFKNKTIQKYLIYFFIIPIGFCFSETLCALVLVEKGFTNSSLQMISLFEVFISIYISIKIEAKKTNFYETFFKAFYYQSILVIVQIIHLCYYDFIFKEIFLENFYVNFGFVLVIGCLLTINSTIMFSCKCGFQNFVADRALGATYITALTSIANLSNKFPKWFILNLAEIVGFQIVAIISAIYNFWYYYFCSKKLIEIESLGSGIWKIESFNKKENDKEEEEKVNNKDNSTSENQLNSKTSTKKNN